MVVSASRLFRKQGYAATGLSQIVARSGAPKGSIYHYFPQGKLSIAAEAVAYSGEKVRSTLYQLQQQAASPGDLIGRYAGLMADWMARSGFQDGCPITTVLLETVPQSETVRVAGAAAFDSWVAVLAESLSRAGLAPGRAQRLAAMSMAALEGALVQARVAVSGQPLLDAAAELALAYDAALA